VFLLSARIDWYSKLQDLFYQERSCSPCQGRSVCPVLQGYITDTVYPGNKPKPRPRSVPQAGGYARTEVPEDFGHRLQDMHPRVLEAGYVAPQPLARADLPRVPAGFVPSPQRRARRSSMVSTKGSFVDESPNAAQSSAAFSRPTSSASKQPNSQRRTQHRSSKVLSPKQQGFDLSTSPAGWAKAHAVPATSPAKSTSSGSQRQRQCNAPLSGQRTARRSGKVGGPQIQPQNSQKQPGFDCTASPADWTAQHGPVFHADKGMTLGQWRAASDAAGATGLEGQGLEGRADGAEAGWDANAEGMDKRGRTLHPEREDSSAGINEIWIVWLVRLIG